MSLTLTVPPESEGERLDRFLAGEVPGVSRSQVQRLIEEGAVQVSRVAVAKANLALRAGALNWGLFFQAHKDTPGKLAVFAYAIEHLEAAGYELLQRVARRAEDEPTVALEYLDRGCEVGAGFLDLLRCSEPRAGDEGGERTTSRPSRKPQPLPHLDVLLWPGRLRRPCVAVVSQP